MTDGGTPVRTQTARLVANGRPQGYGTVLLYPDKLAVVSSSIVKGMTTGAIVVAIPSYLLPPHTGPGALGAVVGIGGGYLIAAAIAKRRAVAMVAAGDSDALVIPLDSVSSLETRKAGRFGGRYLAVMTADGQEYGFGLALTRWGADLANAFTARGRLVRSTPESMLVSPVPDAWGPASAG